MATDPTNAEAAQRRSWSRNASAWAEAVRQESIASRRDVTNAAIVEACLRHQPQTALDVGCGEGWLVRALVAQGVDAVGVDACAELIELARRVGGARYHTCSYEELPQQAPRSNVDLVVANFSLTGGPSVPHLLRTVPQLLSASGRFVMQIGHPASMEGPYRSGWREGSWEGFGTAFTDPAPWYFRTTSDWVREFGEAGLRICALDEPVGHEERPVSLILTGARA